MKKTTHKKKLGKLVAIADRDPKTLTYSQQLRQPEWKSKRKKIIDRDKVCTCCKKKTSLQVHHVRYIDGRLAWQYPDYLLLTLCANCHKLVHADKIPLETATQFSVYEDFSKVFDTLTVIDRSVICTLAKLKTELRQDIPWTETVIKMVKQLVGIDGRQLILAVDRLEKLEFVGFDRERYLVVQQIEFVSESHSYTLPNKSKR